MTCADCKWYNKIEGKYTGTCRYNPVSHYVDSAEMPCSKFDAMICKCEDCLHYHKGNQLVVKCRPELNKDGKGNCTSFKVM